MSFASESTAAHRALRLPDGRRLWVKVWPGRGVPLVLLHGLLDSGEGWDHFACTSRRPCIAVDLPGFGRSDLPTRPRISAYADDVLAGLEQLGVERYVIVGHSLGGAVAAAIAERAPENVEGLVLLAPAGFGRIRLAEAVSVPGVRHLTARALPFALASPIALSAAYMAFVTNGSRPEGAMLARTKARAFEALPGAVEATRAVVAAGASKRAFHRRRLSYDGPVSALWGKNDRVVPRGHAEGVRRAFPHARVETWPAMGHHPQHERPEELHAFIERACAPALRGGTATSLRRAA